jgi:hypothetical protein
MKLQNPEVNISILERNLNNVVSGWGITLSDDVIELMSQVDNESAENIKKKLVSWHNRSVYFNNESKKFNYSYVLYGISRSTFISILQNRCQRLGVKFFLTRNTFRKKMNFLV